MALSESPSVSALFLWAQVMILPTPFKKAERMSDTQISKDLWQIVDYGGLMDCCRKIYMIVIIFPSVNSLPCNHLCLTFQVVFLWIWLSAFVFLLTEQGESQHLLAESYFLVSWILFIGVGWILQNNLRLSSCCKSKPQPLFWVL